MANFCPRCGAPVEKNAVFCTRCGNRIEVQQPAKKNNKGIAILIGAIVGVVGLFLFLGFVWPGILNMKDEKETYTTSFPSESREESRDSSAEKESAAKEVENTQDPSSEAAEERVSNAPAAVIDPALTGTWGFHDASTDVDIVFTFNADGTGNYYANGVDVPIDSYVATKEMFTEYEEDGYLITVYYGSFQGEDENGTFSITLDPIEYGYLIQDDTLKIVFTRDIANDYTLFTRE